MELIVRVPRAEERQTALFKTPLRASKKDVPKPRVA